MNIAPTHLASLSRDTGIPLWNPNDPSYFVRDSPLMENPYLSDYIRFHIPIRSVIGLQKALGDAPLMARLNPMQSEAAGIEANPLSGSFRPAPYMSKQAEVNPLTRPPMPVSEGRSRLMVGTTPGGMSAAFPDQAKVKLAQALYSALKVGHRGESELLSQAGLGPHRVMFTHPTMGAWSEANPETQNIEHHLDPNIAIDVPAHHDAEMRHHIAAILAHLFQQRAIGSEEHNGRNVMPNAIGIRGHYDLPFSMEKAQSVAKDLIANGQHFAPAVYPGERVARAILYPYEGENTGAGYPGGVIPPDKRMQIAIASHAVENILRKHGARSTYLFGLNTGYHDFTGDKAPLHLAGVPAIREAFDALQSVRDAHMPVPSEPVQTSAMPMASMATNTSGVTKGASEEGDEKVAKVMGEFKRGKLKSSSGKKVTSRKQALAIAMSESGMSKKAVGDDVDETLVEQFVAEMRPSFLK